MATKLIDTAPGEATPFRSPLAILLGFGAFVVALVLYGALSH